MPAIDKLLKFLTVKNVAEEIDEEKHIDIINDVIDGYEIDDSSRQQWLDTNKKALEIINNFESQDGTDKSFPFEKASMVIYPLLPQAIIQLASRLIQHLVRNGKVAEARVLGKDQELMLPDPKTGQMTPQGVGIKEAKADRVSNYQNYELLSESKSWLLEQHKLCHMVAAWGVGFKEVYYDEATKKNCSEIISPEDVILNNAITSLEKASRITIRMYMTKNDLLTKIRTGEFLDVDLDKLDSESVDNPMKENDPQELNPVHEILRQFCYMDLDEDEYAEPYWIYVHQNSRKLLGIKPAFDFDGIQTDPKGKIQSIKPVLKLLDFHLIDNPNGNYYSLGLNQLLLHQNRAITSILRQLIDSGILSNTAGSTGFVTKAFKTRERSLRMKLGEFKVLDVPPGTEIQKQIMNLPFKEPSQVLLALLQFMVETGKEAGMMTDVLTGDASAANVPATTMLALVEQGTRAFKPVVQKLYNFEEQELKIRFDLNAKYLDKKKYADFCGVDPRVCAQDFDDKSFSIIPVADPTMSSEAHKYARMQFLIQIMQVAPNGIDEQEALLTLFNGVEFPSPEMMIKPPAPAQPDPKMLDLQLKGKIADQNNQIKQLETQIKAMKVDDDVRKTDIKQQEMVAKHKGDAIKNAKAITDAHKESMDLLNQHAMTQIEGFNALTERKKVEVMDKQADTQARIAAKPNHNQ